MPKERVSSGRESFRKRPRGRKVGWTAAGVFFNLKEGIWHRRGRQGIFPRAEFVCGVGAKAFFCVQASWGVMKIMKKNNEPPRKFDKRVS